MATGEKQRELRTPRAIMSNLLLIAVLLTCLATLGWLLML